ncbi:ferritin-like domain-containing protein [Halobacillus litoralis]|uniref:ferritin-like domain-containing protein n=1 Tax=Halobacillus litoralis TaxID=45668 RepID=UPI001CD5187B|nr:ferritin-like domain-containing protein [Halobacillus litoralis]MCA0970888.1 ferritin-like domain-containing protein [Halobacillus litoralis]
MYYYHPHYFSSVYPYVQQRNGGTSQKLLNEIVKSIEAEATAIEFYTRLAKEAPTKAAEEDVVHALEDEKVHLQEFTNLYTRITGAPPEYTIQPVPFKNFKEGLQTAYRDELEAYESYRNLYLMTQDQTIRDVYLRGFTDEIEHAMRFGFLLMNV